MCILEVKKSDLPSLLRNLGGEGSLGPLFCSTPHPPDRISNKEPKTGGKTAPCTHKGCCYQVDRTKWEEKLPESAGWPMKAGRKLLHPWRTKLNFLVCSIISCHFFIDHQKQKWSGLTRVVHYWPDLTSPRSKSGRDAALEWYWGSCKGEWEKFSTSEIRLGEKKIEVEIFKANEKSSTHVKT